MSLTITLSENTAIKVEGWLASGLYGSVQEVIEDAVNLLARREQENSEKLARLRQAVQEGLDSGECTPWDPAEVEQLALQMRKNGEFD